MKITVENIEGEVHELYPGAKYLLVVNRRLAPIEDIIDLKKTLEGMASDCIILLSDGHPDDTAKVYKIVSEVSEDE